VRKGELDQKKIGKAYEIKHQKPHLRRYDFKEGQTKEEAMAEEQALVRAMSGEAEEAAPKKRGKKS
jgi:hypothetical protein